jgi:hypothetical protein
MSYFSLLTRANVISDARTVVPQLWANTRTIFLNDLPPDFGLLSEPMKKLAFATVLAFDLKPYGPSNPATLEEFLCAPDCNCDNYCIAAVELYRLLNPTGLPEPAFVGWNGGAVSNHAQLLGTHNGTHILCDPTIGLVALDVTLSGLCRGYPPMSGRWKSFFSYSADRTNVAAFNLAVINAVTSGKYMASDLLFYAPSLAKFRGLPGSGSWATPQSWQL